MTTRRKILAFAAAIGLGGIAGRIEAKRESAVFPPAPVARVKNVIVSATGTRDTAVQLIVWSGISPFGIGAAAPAGVGRCLECGAVAKVGSNLCAKHLATVGYGEA